MVIFGAAGDLTKRKLIPSLYNLAREKLLPDEFAVLGVARADLDHAGFRKQLADEIAGFVPGKLDPKLWEWLEKRPSTTSLEGNLDDPETFKRLSVELEHIEGQHRTRGNLLFYLATSPTTSPA